MRLVGGSRAFSSVGTVWAVLVEARVLRSIEPTMWAGGSGALCARKSSCDRGSPPKIGASGCGTSPPKARLGVLRDEGASPPKARLGVYAMRERAHPANTGDRTESGHEAACPGEVDAEVVWVGEGARTGDILVSGREGESGLKNPRWCCPYRGDRTS